MLNVVCRHLVLANLIIFRMFHCFIIIIFSHRLFFCCSGLVREVILQLVQALAFDQKPTLQFLMTNKKTINKKVYQISCFISYCFYGKRATILNIKVRFS